MIDFQRMLLIFHIGCLSNCTRMLTGPERLLFKLIAFVPAFWITETVAYEQPQVLDNGKYVIIVDGMRPDSSGTAEPFQIVSTSSYGLNALLGSTFRAPVIQVMLICFKAVACAHAALVM